MSLKFFSTKNQLLCFLLIIFVICLYACNATPSLDVDKYEDYICYDYHLYCLDAYNESVSVKKEINNFRYNFVYRYPVNETDDQFVCASIKRQFMFFAAGTNIRVLQNPNQLIKVWEQWTIKEVQIYYMDIATSLPLEKEEAPARTPTKIINATTNADIISELKSFVSSKKTIESSAAENYQCKISEDLMEYDYQWYVRVLFNESKNIVWETEIRSCYSAETGECLIMLDNGTETDIFYSAQQQWFSLDDYPVLSTFVADAIEKSVLKD